MNLKEIYELFYPRKNKEKISVWKSRPKYQTKTDFFEGIFPMETRWLNGKLWNDKARRSRFFADSKTENKYVTSLKELILQEPLTISRMEMKGKLFFQDNLLKEEMNRVFFQVVEREEIQFSSMLRDHLINKETGEIKQEWGNILTFFILYAMFPKEINQLYASYLYRRGNEGLLLSEEKKSRKDEAKFQYEYPPDMSVFRAGEMITHTWGLKNTGETLWKNRYFECISCPFPLEENNRKLLLPEIVYPGDTISPTVCFCAPNTAGVYSLNWKMKDEDGKIAFLGGLGIGLHFTVVEKDTAYDIDVRNNYKVVEEKPKIPPMLIAGEMYSHMWTLENTGTVVWKNYYCECINGESFGYTKKELNISLKEIVCPGEKVSILTEFVTPPVEGTYRLIWRIVGKDGKPVFAGERQLEILLNLI